MLEVSSFPWGLRVEWPTPQLLAPLWPRLRYVRWDRPSRNYFITQTAVLTCIVPLLPTREPLQIISVTNRLHFPRAPFSLLLFTPLLSGPPSCAYFCHVIWKFQGIHGKSLRHLPSLLSLSLSLSSFLSLIAKMLSVDILHFLRVIHIFYTFCIFCYCLMLISFH